MIKYWLSEPNAEGIRLTFERKTPGSSGYDLHNNGIDRLLSAGRWMTFRTGLFIATPLGVEAQVRPRSGLARGHGIIAATGSIDSDFRGECTVTMFNHGPTDYKVLAGERIAQLMFAVVLIPGAPPYNLEPPPELVACHADLGSTDRGTSGHGSTGRL